MNAPLIYILVVDMRHVLHTPTAWAPKAQSRYRHRQEITSLQNQDELPEEAHAEVNPDL